MPDSLQDAPTRVNVQDAILRRGFRPPPTRPPTTHAPGSLLREATLLLPAVSVMPPAGSRRRAHADSLGKDSCSAQHATPIPTTTSSRGTRGTAAHPVTSVLHGRGLFLRTDKPVSSWMGSMHQPHVPPVTPVRNERVPRFASCSRQNPVHASTVMALRVRLTRKSSEDCMKQREGIRRPSVRIAVVLPRQHRGLGGIRIPAGRVLPIITLAMFLAAPAAAQTSPHGNITVPCDQCHSAQSWKTLRSPLGFDHARTDFPLRGQHVNVRCAGCHPSLKFSGTTTRCADCHQDLHRGELGTQCDRCHSPSTWLVSDMVRKHSTTRFALVGAHATALCQSCHPNQQKHSYVGIRTDCYACHATDYQNARSPDHGAAGFSTDCSQCHKVNDVRFGGGFDHSRSSFPLTGAHRAVPCTHCHKTPVFAGTPSVCYTCHQQVFQNAVNPRHVPGFSIQCVTCHTTAAWRPASFIHANTRFALVGAHIAVSCNSCHKNGVYTGTPMTCGDAACHLTAYNTTTNPAHLSSGFPLTCGTCHSMNGWKPASFDHTTARFRLTGAHLAVSCNSCHKNGVYTGTPMTCGDAACHLTTYNNTTKPIHASSGFSPTCESCHTTTAWLPSTFNHTPLFPISAGSRHSPGRWSVCADCHTVSTDYKVFSCIDCHQHSPQTKVDGQHVGRANYSYTSKACYSCHPQGRS